METKKLMVEPLITVDKNGDYRIQYPIIMQVREEGDNLIVQPEAVNLSSEEIERRMEGNGASEGE